MNPFLEPSLITSFNSRSTLEALSDLGRPERLAGLLGHAGASVDTVDLYCFGPRDPKLLCGDPEAPRGGMMQWLGSLTSRQLKTIACRLGKYLTSGLPRRRGVACLATNLPCISVPDSPGEAPRRQAVRAIKKLLLLAHELGVSCVEIVCGSNFIRTGQLAAEWETQVGTYCANRRRAALVESLASLDRWIELQHFSPPVGLAVELEPGPSYGVNSGHEAMSLFDALDHRLRHRAQHVALNLDIGHAWLISTLREKELPMLLREHFIDRIAHAHLSVHAPTAHFSDLPVTEAMLNDAFQPWIDLFKDSQAGDNRCKFATHTIAIEQEGAIPQSRAVGSYIALREWLTDRGYRTADVIAQTHTARSGAPSMT